MKHYSLSILIALLLFTGCDQILNTQPQQSVSQERALETPEGVKKTLVGAYRALGNSNVYGGRLYLLPDLLGLYDEVSYTGTQPPPREILHKNITEDNGFITDLWLQSYSAINAANSVLSALDILGPDRDRVEGEARFIRAVIYFQLVNVFGRDYSDGDPQQNLGVPLVLTATDEINETANVPRASVEEVYAQVIDDLKTAKTKLEAQPYQYIYADTYVASAFLARVYLQQGKFEPARDEANRVLTEGPYSLVNQYAAAFNNSGSNTTEDVFALQVTTQDGSNALHSVYASINKGGSNSYSVAVTQKHLDYYASGDERSDLFYNEGTADWYTGKWKNRYGNVNLFRLAELYLIRAETNERLNESVGATPLQDFNKIHERAGLPAVSSVTLQDILEERRLELAFEGHFLFDLKRTQGSINGVNWDSPRLIFPIPLRELDANPLLVPNE